MQVVKLVLAFAPWLAFLLIAQGSMLRLKAGLLVALSLCVVMGLARLHRGIILWVGLLFFSAATLAVVGFENLWTVQYMGILANGTLACSTWLTVALKKPFTLEYSREHTAPSLWNDPLFIRSNMLITSAWGLAFTLNAVLAWGKLERLVLPEWGYEVVSYSILAATVAFTTWYPKALRQRRLSAQGGNPAAGGATQSPGR